MYKKIVALAIPNIISNITIPLVGMADLAVVGLLGNDGLLSAMAISTAIFNMLYYSCTFLRMGTSGLTAQGYGSKNFTEMAEVLLRGLGLSMLIGIVILICNRYIEAGSLWFMGASDEVECAASAYYRIRIWAVPATLSLYVFQGWFIGMQNSRTPMWVALLINVINITLSFVFAIILKMGLEGVAYGTLVAQWVGVLASVIVVLRYYRRVFINGNIGRHSVRDILNGAKLRAFFTLNTNIFVRTICLVMVFTYFTKASSEGGDTLLAANTLLMQLFTLFSYFMDGFAYAAEALVGKFYGAGNFEMLHRAISRVFRIGYLTGLAFCVLYILFGEQLMIIFTRSEDVLRVAGDYMLWAAAIPLCGVAAFLWDGILVGMTVSRFLRDSMIGATFMFFLLYFSLEWCMGNNALWVAFLSFLATRGILQWFMTRKTLKKQQTLAEVFNKRIEKIKRIRWQ